MYLAIKVSNIKINEIYKTSSIECGALGGKVIGSGGGGFILFCCEKKNQSKLKKNLKKLPIIKFKFINEGSQIIFNK